MKKIIMAVAAIAMAVSMFAADVSAKVKLDGTIACYDGDKFKMLEISHRVDEPHNPILAFATSGDRAGASFKFWTGNQATLNNDPSNFDFSSVGYSIWFKPLDMLKVTVGNFSTNLNQETILYCNSDTAIDSYGYALSLDISGFTADLFLAPGIGDGNPLNSINNTVTGPLFWFDGKDIAKTYVKLGYAADFGAINAMVWLDAKKIAFGAGYKNTFDPVTMFINVLGYLNDGTFAGIRAEPFVTTNINGIGISAFIPLTYVIKGASMFATDGKNWHKGHIGYSGVKDNQVILGTVLKVTFPIGNIGGYVAIEENDWLAKSFALNIKPGVTGSVGAMGWETYIDVALSKPENGDFKATVTVPVSFTVNF